MTRTPPLFVLALLLAPVVHAAEPVSVEKIDAVVTAELKKQKDAWESELNSWGQADGAPIAPRRALRELEKAMPKNAMVTTDIGNICSVSNSYLRFEQPRSFFAAAEWQE